MYSVMFDQTTDLYNISWAWLTERYFDCKQVYVSFSEPSHPADYLGIEDEIDDPKKSSLNSLFLRYYLRDSRVQSYNKYYNL